MRAGFLLFIPVFISILSCGNSGNNKAAVSRKTTVPAPAAAAPATLLSKENTDNLMAVVNAYYELKDALVATNITKADEAGSRVMSATENLNYYLQHEKDAYTRMHPYLDTVMTQSEALVNAKTNTAEAKRVYFAKISGAMFAALQQAKLKNGGVYYEYCPMALNSKGAFWLSSESEIKNPYFGKKMIECGEVRDSL